MPLIKEVFFKNRKKEIAFYNKEEMLEKATSWVSESDKKDSAKKQKSILKSLNWFQKITFGEKEFFVEKSENPLQIKETLIEKEGSEDGLGLIAFVSLIPLCLTPVAVYGFIKNQMNKRKAKKGENVYLKNMDSNIGFYASMFLISNILAIIALCYFKLGSLYLGVVASNFIFGLLGFKTPYSNVENYDLVNFRLEEGEFSESDGIESKIKNMKGKEVYTQNKKHEYEFLKELDLSKEEISKNPFDKAQKNMKQRL